MPRTLLAPSLSLSLSLSVSKCSTSFNMFLEFSGFLLCRQCGPIRWSHQASICFGAWFDFVCARQWIVELLDRWIAHWLWSWCYLWQLLLLLALIWRHCHRYKTSFVSSTVPQYAVCLSGQGIAIGIRCAYFEYYKLSSSPLSLSLFLSLSLSQSLSVSLSLSFLCSRIEISCSVSGCGSLDSLWHYQRVCIRIWFRVKFTHDL